MGQETCSTCAYWAEDEEDKGHGACRFNPPQVVCGNTDLPYLGLVAVPGDYWCGQHVTHELCDAAKELAMNAARNAKRMREAMDRSLDLIEKDQDFLENLTLGDQRADEISDAL